MLRSSSKAAVLSVAPAVLSLVLARWSSAQDNSRAETRPSPEQERGQTPASQPAPRLEPPLLRLPEHRDLIVAVIGDESIRLDQVLAHVESRHAPGLRDHLASREGLRELNSPLVPLWTRLYCDMRVLRDAAAARGITDAEVDEGIGAALRVGFDAFRDRYVEGRQKQGRPVLWTRELEAEFLPRFRKEEGLKAEIKALLDVLVPDLFKESEVRAHHAERGDYFGGEVQISHIMVRHRDPLTGRLWSDADQARIKETLRDIRSRIRPDGINFAAIAQSFSEDVRSGRQGGEIGSFGRLDQRLPAVIVREAWKLRDGEWAGPFESPEGMHIVRRTSFSQHTYILLQGKELARVRAHLRALRQEELVFDLRAKRKLSLRI